VGTPGRGYFTGVGITDSANGIFDPDTSGAGVFDILYYFNGCPDSVLVTVIPIQAGLDNASCPGASPFTVYPGSPGVGTWSGNYIQPNGVFDPLVTGTHTIFYSVNGCIDSKFVYVDTLWIQIGDSICDVDPPYNLAFSPQGGVWTGIGITDTVNGVFDPGVSGVGIFQLIYTANGCADTLDMRVDLINAGVNETACPTQGPYTLTAGLPSGGIWAGIGIIDSILGIFDPGIQGGNYNDSLTYTFVGCSDIKVIYVRQTVIAVDTLTFCPADDSIFLNWTNVGRNPWDGVWKGPGVTDSMFPGVFDPGVTGPGMYMLTYTANICYDSIIMHVYDYPVTQNDTTVCISSSPFNLSAIPPNGLWSGNGIINANDGTFNPAVVGIGTFKVYYTSPGGCIDSMNVSTDTLPLVNLSGLVNVYCYLDTNIVMSGSPLGGTFSGAGVSGSIFNPKNAGGGVHTIKYTFANGVCTVTDSMIVSVYDPLVISLPFVLDTICFGDSVLLTAMSLGGDTNALHIYTWDNGLGTGPTQWLKADSQTTFTVIVSDGCSISDTGTLTIFIQPEFLLMIDTSNSVCFGDTGYAKVTVTGSGAFIYEWNTDPPNYTDSISSVGGLYTITVTNTMTGCILDEEIEIPSYNPIYAFFKPSPDKECFNTLEDVIYFIDLSVGGKTGIWDFGDGQTKPYISPENPVHLYSAPGYYTISLYLENEGGCKSEHSSLICLEEKSTLFVPTAFTPDGDGLNDVFQVVSFGVTEINFAIYSRWGDEVFQTNDPNIGWDGRFRGKVMPQGVYVYFVDYRTKESPWLQKKKGSLVLIR
ncbi:MAG: gliding motility-associated C-terminal domain-containing protein, partial [Bacteroidetes bacterium]|nr:gliding motility-associated C-terminal domain-containing protein [Bacteroidota bacterium]